MRKSTIILFVSYCTKDKTAIHLYSMEKKSFKSRLFNRKIIENEKDYWIYLYADVLFRLKQLEEFNCPCGKCFDDKRNYNWLIKSLIQDNHIKENPKPINFTGKGDCGRAQKK